MSEAITGATVCKAGRACKCVYKRNATIWQGAVKITVCAISADVKTCSFGGTVVP